MRYAFVGAVRFSAACLEAVLDLGVDVPAILCPEASSFNADFADLGSVAASRSRTVRRFKKIADEAAYLKELAPDIILIMGLSQILPPSVLGAAKVGCLGSHPALLPRNRGRHPIIWTLANGLEEGGLSMLWLDEGIDSGDLWRQRSFPVTPSDDAGSVYEKVCDLGAEMLREGIPELERGVVARVPQDASQANYWRKRTVEDGRIDWRMTSKRIVDLVRALRPPYLGAHFLQDGAERKVWRAVARDGRGLERFEPGRVMSSSPLLVKTGDGCVELQESEIVPPPKEGTYLS